MEICINCFFDNKSEFEKAKEYLGVTLEHEIYTSIDEPNEYPEGTYWINDDSSITQDQLNELTALCPIRPKREITKEGIYSKIAYGIGLHGLSYNPDDMLDNETLEDCKILWLDPSMITLGLMAEFDVLPDYIKF